jgi:hypothetical protein
MWKEAALDSNYIDIHQSEQKKIHEKTQDVRIRAKITTRSCLAHSVLNHSKDL